MIWANQPIHLFPCWMSEPLTPRNQRTSCFAPAGVSHHASTTYSFYAVFGGGGLFEIGMLAVVGVLMQELQALHSQKECRLKLEQQFSRS